MPQGSKACIYHRTPFFSRKNAGMPKVSKACILLKSLFLSQKHVFWSKHLFLETKNMFWGSKNMFLGSKNMFLAPQTRFWTQKPHVLDPKTGLFWGGGKNAFWDPQKHVVGTPKNAFLHPQKTRKSQFFDIIGP